MAKSKRVFNGVGMLADLPPVQSTEGKLTDIQVGFITEGIRTALRAINGKLSFGNGVNSTQAGNIDGQTKELTFLTANFDYEVPHGLGRVPIGILPLDVNQDGAVMRGGSRGSWSSERLFVRCNVAGTTGLFVVV